MKIKLKKKINFIFLDSMSGFTLTELLLVFAIMAVMFGAVTAMKSPFQKRMNLLDSARALQADLRSAQLYSISRNDGYYAVRFYGNLGRDILGASEPVRQGWKIIRYDWASLPITNFDSPVPTVIKSCVIADNPQIFDKTFFVSNLISFSAASEFDTSGTPPRLHSIIFDHRGSATRDGLNLLTTANDLIVLSTVGRNATIQITPLTGHTEVQEIR